MNTADREYRSTGHVGVDCAKFEHRDHPTRALPYTVEGMELLQMVARDRSGRHHRGTVIFPEGTNPKHQARSPTMRIPFILAALMAGFSATTAGATTAAAPGVSLPAPPRAGAMSLEESLALRRSVRDFSDEALTLADASRLVWAAQGITAPGHRTTPSAGATYPLEIYLAAGKVEGLAAGVYRYLPERHRLEFVSEGDIRERLADAAMNQEWLRSAPMVMVIAAVLDRTAARYGRRAERYVNMEAGHAAQNLLLQATALGLGATPVGAFDDAEVTRLLHLPVGQAPRYLIPVGRPARP